MRRRIASLAGWLLLAALGACIATVLLTGCGHTRQITAIGIESVATGADLYTTQRAIQRGAIEGNPVLRHNGRTIMVGLSITCAALTWRECDQSKGRCITAVTLCSAPHAIAAVHNETIR